MELTTRGRYAVMAMADIALHQSGRAVPLPMVAERQQISLAYLEQIFVPLRRAGLVRSTRGRSGGYVLDRPADAIRISEIMASVQESTQMTRCMEDGTLSCQGRPGRCLTHKLWHALGSEIRTFLDGVTLADVIASAPTSMPTSTPHIANERAAGAKSSDAAPTPGETRT